MPHQENPHCQHFHKIDCRDFSHAALLDDVLIDSIILETVNHEDCLPGMQTDADRKSSLRCKIKTAMSLILRKGNGFLPNALYSWVFRMPCLLNLTGLTRSVKPVLDSPSSTLHARSFNQTRVRRKDAHEEKSDLATHLSASKYKGMPVLNLTWQDNTISSFPFIYLRDNCQCPECFESSAIQRIVNCPLTSDLHIEPTTVELENQNQILSITWPDGHISRFQVSWLKEREFPKTREEQVENSNRFLPKKSFWGGEFKIPVSDFQSVIDDDLHRYKWLFDLSTYGLTLLKNAPLQKDQLPKISEKVGGIIRQTHYGSVFKVQSKPDPSNLAYSTHETPFHVDLAYYNYQPGTQFLHCIQQTKDETGGSNYFVDGYYLAEVMRKQHPDAYNALTNIKFTFRDIGQDEYGQFEKKLERPLISLDDLGNYNHIAHNNFTRSSFINAPLEDVLKLYKAYFIWTKALNSEENKFEYKMEPGDVLAFDNIRVLHGRRKFDSMASPRYLEGFYIDWDEVYSTLRTLRRKLGLVQGDSNSW